MEYVENIIREVEELEAERSALDAIIAASVVASFQEVGHEDA